MSRALGLRHSTILAWRQVPAKHCLAVADLTGIPLHELRGDVYRADPAAAQDAA